MSEEHKARLACATDGMSSEGRQVEILSRGSLVFRRDSSGAQTFSALVRIISMRVYIYIYIYIYIHIYI